MLRALLLACALIAAAIAFDGALTDPELLTRPDLSGSLRIPLDASTGGRTYALRDVTVELSGTAMLTLSARDGEQALTTPLPSGAYGAFVRPGYRVVEIDADGVEHPVDATLTGANPLRVQLNDLRESTLELAFAHAGGVLVFGGRTLREATSAR